MGSISSLLSNLESTSSPSVSQLLGQSSTSGATSASSSSQIQSAVNAILNSATNTSGGGINVQSTVDAILQIDAAPEQALLQQVTGLNTQTTALQSIQTDLTALQTSAQALSDPAGAFGAVTVSSDDSGVSATATNGAALGPHSVMVNSLATTSAYYSTDFTSAAPFPTSGSLQIQVGTDHAQTVNIDSADGTTTLSGLVQYINQNDLGVNASVVTDTSGSRLSLISQTSGSAGILSITDNTGANGSNGFSGLTQAVDNNGKPLGTDASLTVDGVPITSGSNTVTGAIPGVTLTLAGQTVSPATIGVQPDLTQVATVINNFVTAYNKVIGDINAQNTITNGTAPPLLGDPSLDLLQSQLLSSVTTSISGNSGLVNLQSIGIQMQADGTLSVASSSSADSMDLNDALTNDFAAVQNLFQSTSTSSPGVAQALNTQLTSINNVVSGPLSLDMTGIASEVTDLNTQITNFQAQLQETQTQLTTEYSTINTTLEQLPQTLASINSQLTALNPPQTS